MFCFPFFIERGITDLDFCGLSAEDVLNMFDIPTQGVEFYGLLKAFVAKNPPPPPTQLDMTNVVENESISTDMINHEIFVNTTWTPQFTDGHESMEYEEGEVPTTLVEDCIVQDHCYLVQQNTPPHESPQQDNPQEPPQQNTLPNTSSKCKILLFH